MSDKHEIIKNGYIAFGFPAEKRLFNLLTKEHPSITKEDIKDFLGHQEAEQIYKPHQNPKRSKQGSITAYSVNERWQMDIFSFFNFVDSWKKSEYKYTLCCIDIFTRKAWAIPMTDKSTESTIKAFEEILTENKDNYPKIIIADQDSVFLSDAFNQILDKYNIILDVYIKGDHNALGIIDAYAKRLKLQLAKYVLVMDYTINWHKLLDKVVENYNNTPNTSIDDIKPNDAHKPENVETIFSINVFKKKGRTVESDLVKGDPVRIRILKNIHTKSSSPQFSNELYTVEETHGNNITLSNGKIYKRYSILKVVSYAKPILHNRQQKIKNARNVHKELKQIDQEENEISVDQPRQKRSNAGQHSVRFDPSKP